MRAFRSLHLQKHLGDVLTSADAGPVVLLNRGQPRVVVMSAEEFRRLKRAAKEPVPSAALPRTARVVHVGQDPDPLGYDTRDFRACVRAMASDAASPAKAAAIEAEAGRLRAALRAAGLLPKLAASR